MINRLAERRAEQLTMERTQELQAEVVKLRAEVARLQAERDAALGARDATCDRLT